MAKTERRAITRETVLKRNTKVHAGTVAAHEQLERELKKLGVDTKPHFSIEPPLGSNLIRLHNRNG